MEEYPLQDKASCRLTQVINDMIPQSNGRVEGNTRQEKLQTLLDQTNWEHLEVNEKRQLFRVIKKHHPLFILEEKDLGLMKTTPAHIQVAEPTPCRSVIYRYADKAKEIIKNMIEDMKRKDIIENATSAWLSPIVLVNKPNGEKRMCLDNRKVSQHLSVDIHPLPKLDELAESAAGNSYYAALDMKDAYYQVKVDEASRDLTTFSEGVALYSFNRLPFGLSCSAAIFARQLARVLTPLLKENWLRSYLDNIIIYAPTYNTLLQLLDKLFKHMT